MQTIQRALLAPASRASRVRCARLAARLCRSTRAASASATEQGEAGHDHVQWRAAIDYKAVRDNLDATVANVAVRRAAGDPALVVKLYEQFLSLKTRVDGTREQRNATAASMKGKLDDAQRAALVAEGKRLKDELAVIEAQLDEVEVVLYREGQRLPNATHPEVPHGGEENAVTLREVGAPRQFDFKPQDHVAIGEAMGLFDFEAAGKSSGSRFVYLKGNAALLELALVQWAMSRAMAAGFTLYSTPDLVRTASMEKCGFQPRGENSQVYNVTGHDLCLTGTAEIPLGAIYMDETVSEAQLPIKMAAFGHCFRTEAGAGGVATRGLYRLHQFSKVELFILATPEQSDALHLELLEFESSLFAELGLHFKVLDMPTHDLGAPAYRKFDVEAWMPGLARYGEISSASNCTDYQARRLNIRYRPAADGKEEAEKEGGKGKGAAAGKKAPLRFVHTLNATACAVPRMLISILETHQQADGSVKIPEPLWPYMCGMQTLSPPPAPAAR